MNDSSAPNLNKDNRLDLATRVFQNGSFELTWMLFIAAFGMFVTFPVQRVLAVWWISGVDAYYKHGVRVVPRKPLRFSTGVLVPQSVEIITGFGLFLVTFFGLTLTLFCVLRAYDRWLGLQLSARSEGFTSSPRAESPVTPNSCNNASR